MVSRLFQIVYILMERESVTASELAEKLEVSIRTINRDIEKLSEARIPVYASRGRNGGISLIPDFVLNKKVLSEEEKTDILSSMRVMSAVGYEDEQKALSKLEEFFGESAQDWIEVELDSWGQGEFNKERFMLLKKAVLNHHKLRFGYNSTKGNSVRTVRPGKLVFRSQAWYLYAFCELRNEFRYFKINRMEDIEVLAEHFVPDKFPKEEKHYIEFSEPFEATFAVDKKLAYRIVDELPMKDAIEEENRYIFKVPDARKGWFYDYVLSLGPYAEVLSPKEVRDEMKKRVTKLYNVYN